MAFFSDQKGASRLKVLLILVVLFLAIHSGMKVLSMYMDFERMHDEMKMKAGLAQILKDDEILRDLVQKAEELDLPLTKESFVLRRDEEHRRMYVSTQWDVEVHFLWGAYIRTFHFAPAVDENFMSVR